MRSGLRFRVAGAAVVVASVVSNGLFLSAGSVLAVSAPAARWTFDAGSGTTVADAVGSATGTRGGGASWITSGAAVGSGAMHFDGVDGHVDIPNTAAIDPAGFTLTMWVRAPAIDPPVYPEVIVQKGAVGCSGPNWGVRLLNNGIQLTYQADSGQFSTGSTSFDVFRTPVWDGAWHFLSFSLGGSGGVYTLAIDGSPKFGLNSSIGPLSYASATDDSLRIGGPVDPTCGDSFFKGDIDDVRLYADPDFDASGLLTPIPTTTTVAAVPSPIGVYDPFDFHATVSPAPRWGKTMMEFVDLSTGDVVDGGEITLGADGTVTAVGRIPWPAGDYQLRVRFLGQGPWQPSSAAVSYTSTRVPTTTTLSVSPASPLPLTSTDLTASIVGDVEVYMQRPEGSVSFYDSTSGTPVLLGTTPAAYTKYDVFGNAQATLTLPVGLDVGSRKLSAVFTTSNRVYATSTSPTVTVAVPLADSTAQVVTPSGIEANHAFVLDGYAYPTGAFTATGATLKFYRSGVATPLCTTAVVANGTTHCSVPALPAGSYQFQVVYSGNSKTNPSTSPWEPMTVVTDAVHATGVSLQYTTFYPYKDSYEDTVAIKGTRNEPISVTIKIYSPGGTLLKTVSIASGTGAYSYAWNGRNSAGTWYAEGKYKVVQTLRDTVGTTLTSTLYTTLSKKRMYSYTKTVAHYGTTFAAKGTSGTGTLSFNTTSHYVLVKAGSNGWAGVGWEFALPSATIYKSIKFQADAKSGLIGGLAQIGMQNFAACPYSTGTTWNTSCFDKLKQVGNPAGTTAWYTSYGSVTTNRSGTHARGTISVAAGSVYVYKVQVVVTYGILKY